MSRARLVQTVLVTLAIVLISSGIAVKWSASGRMLPQPGEELMYFPSGKVLEQSSLGHGSTLADMAWLRAIQYYGHHKLTDKKYDMIGHIFDIVTTLDPNFIHAYVFGAVILSQDAGEPEEAIALLKKGMRHNPENWLLAFEAGFVYYTALHDYPGAARYFALSSRLPNAPEFTSRFAAFTEERSGRTEVAIEMWEQAAKTTSNKYIREIAEEKIKELRKELERKGARQGVGSS